MPKPIGTLFGNNLLPNPNLHEADPNTLHTPKSDEFRTYNSSHNNERIFRLIQIHWSDTPPKNLLEHSTQFHQPKNTIFNPICRSFQYLLALSCDKDGLENRDATEDPTN